MLISRDAKKRIGLLISVFVMVFAFRMLTLAKEPIDPEQEVTLTLFYKDQSVSIVGAEFQLYQAGDISESGTLELSGEFASYPVSLENLDSTGWKNLAETLTGYVRRDGILPVDEARTNEYGVLKFPGEQESLKPGLYLIVGKRHVQNGKVYTAEPFLAGIPDQNEALGEWAYDVTAIPKHENSSDDSGTVKRKVLKVWKDEGYTYKRPKEITVRLLKDGAVYDTVTLTEKEQWRYTWENLDSGYEWLVVEDNVKNYTVSTGKEGITFVVTNTYVPPKKDDSGGSDGGGGGNTPDKPEPSGNSGGSSETTTTLGEGEMPLASLPNLPQTGQLWWPVPLLVMAGLICVIVGCWMRKDHT